MTNEKIKLYILQVRYKYLSELIINLEKHIDILYNYFIINFSDKNNILGFLFEISKKLNLLYNNYVNNNLYLGDKLENIINTLNLELENDIYYSKLLYEFHNILPLFEIEEELIKIILEYGYTNIKDLLKILNISNDLLIINEINNIFVPLKVQYFNVKKTVEYYWNIPKHFQDSDYLELTRELWIKTNDKYLRIDGIFINDSISCFFKTSQLNYNIFNKLKNDIIVKIDNISYLQFIKKFIRYDYIGNIYCLSTQKYIQYLENNFNKYTELVSLTFVNIMKKFISSNTNIKNIYDIIYLLLLGNNNNIDMAGLLLDVLKEKKNNISLIYNLICNRLPYYLLIKINKSHINIKNELDNLKSMSLTNINYKKLLISNKNIPNNVKILTLEKINEMKNNNNNDYYKQLTYVKSIIGYPWSSENDKFLININSSTYEYLHNIEDNLKKLSYGHENAKKSLLQTIGKWISNPISTGNCFGFIGPPGVGKTLLAKSVSKALNIPYAEITLGGQNDGELLYGHGYTYSGAQPGLIVKKMIEMGKSRCILYFDELDKTCSKHGSINEITSILIHLTDPNMNKSFQDRFFQGIDFPLDKVIMIFSYNDSKLIDPILLDRLTQIEIDSYTLYDKIKIVKEFIIPEISASVNLNLEFSDELIEFIIENYTNEAGVRSIKRKIEEIYLNLNLNKIYNNNLTNIVTKEMNNIVTKEIILEILEKPKNEICLINDEPSIGIMNGLYATSNGDGGIIPIQIFNNYSSNIKSFEIKLTGKQGDIMKESVYCSLTTAIDYIRKNKELYNIDNLDEYLQNNFPYGFHVHTPSTATPKDGPSAGCAFTTAFISRILKKKLKNDVAMTGEIELTGKITKIGGLNFKLIGAKKAGVKLVYVPSENENDIEEIKLKYPNLISNNFDVKYFNNIDKIINEILI
jgi:endopeptidase La